MNHKTTLSDYLDCESRKIGYKGSLKNKLGDPRRPQTIHLSHGDKEKILDYAYLEASYGSLGGKQEDGGQKKSKLDAGLYYSVSDIIGSFGLFQFLVLLFSGIRESTVGYDAVISSVILQPENNFECIEEVQPTNFHLMHETNETLLRKSAPVFDTFSNEQLRQCYHTLNGHLIIADIDNQPMRCNLWSFPDAYERGSSLRTEWSLVCHRHWIGAFIESAYFLGLVTGNLVWGFTADMIGRRRAYLASHTVALIFGLASIVAPNVWIFIICRYLAAFGSVGYNIIYTIQVEIIGKEHRSLSTVLNHLGWGTGVILVPIVNRLLPNYQPKISIVPLITLITYPWAFWLPESSRWLMMNDRIPEARAELVRAAKLNGKTIDMSFERKIECIREKTENDKRAMEMEFGIGKRKDASKRGILSMLRDNRILRRDALILSYVAFLGHLFYYVLTINFAYVKNLSIDANFISSGAGEWFSVLIGAILLRYFCSRKTCMTLFLFLMSSSFIFQSLIEAKIMPSLDTKFIVTLNNSIGTLSGLLLIFIVLIVNQEIFPTVIRQTGSSLINTIGESGSTLAPQIIHLGLLIGPWRANLLYSFICSIGMVSIQYLSRTDDIELPDS